ncbi:MAG: hypothetical protein AABY15_06400 [Nanoarchaeota archaeon]
MSIRKAIIKSNRWYDNLKEPNRTFFFIFIVMVPLFFTQFLLVVYEVWWPTPLWALVFILWRMSYFLIK